MVPATDTRLLTAVTFRVGTQRYAFSADRVREIQQIVAFADVPDESGLVMGMVDVRGDIAPVIDARSLIGLPAEPYTLQTPMIVVSGPVGPVALIVDAVDSLVELDAGEGGPAPALHSLASRILGVHHLDGDLLFLLDVDALLEPVAFPAQPDGDGDE